MNVNNIVFLFKILDRSICMHAVSQGALGVECRSDDSLVISMLNRLNHEETVLRCIAERTFMAKLEGGCSAPIAVESRVTPNSIVLEGAVFDLDGSRKIQDRFEIKFDNSESTCPVVNMSLPKSQKPEETTNNSSSSKRKLEDDEEEKRDGEEEIGTPKKSMKVAAIKDEVGSGDHRNKAYSFIIDLNIQENRLIKAELCGLHLAERLKDKGADVLINEIKAQIHKSSF